MAQKTREVDVHRFNNSVFISFALKVLLVLRLRAIWNKDLIGARARRVCQWACYIQNFISSHTDFIFYNSRCVEFYFRSIQMIDSREQLRSW